MFLPRCKSFLPIVPFIGQRNISQQYFFFSRRLLAIRSVSNNNSNGPPPPKRHHRLLFPEELNILYDSKCNVCRTEVEFLKRRDASHNHPRPRLKCTDLENGRYDPKDPANGGITYAQAMKSMHAVTNTGEILSGVAVFQRAYQIVGLGWLLTITKYSGMKWIADGIYNVFAKHRTKITRGATLDELVTAYEERQQMVQTQCSNTSSAASNPTSKHQSPLLKKERKKR